MIVVPLPQDQRPLKPLVALETSQLSVLEPKGLGNVLPNCLGSFELEKHLVSREAVDRGAHELSVYGARPVHFDEAALGILGLENLLDLGPDLGNFFQEQCLVLQGEGGYVLVLGL